jgi:hypothetical protein
MRHLKFLVIFFALVVAFSSCKKDDPKATKTSDIVRTWQVNKLSAKVGTFELVVYEKGKNDNMQDFSKFRLTFQKDGKYTGVDDEGQKTGGTWAFKDNETKLVLDEGTSSAVTFNIQKLSSGNLDISTTQTEDGVTSVVTFFLIPA